MSDFLVTNEAGIKHEEACFPSSWLVQPRSPWYDVKLDLKIKIKIKINNIFVSSVVIILN